MKKIILIIFLSFLIIPRLSLAFDEDNIISNWDMEDHASMSLSRIKSFLESQGGALANYYTTDTDGKNVHASKIIYNAAQRYSLSPKFIITHLQKESSLVTSGSTSSSLLDWAMGFGVCDSCSKNSPSVKQYKGFAKQIYAAADRIRNGYLNDLNTRGYTISGWGPGISKKTSDSVWVTPANKATAVLYTYTPWVGYHGGNSSVGGNSLFYDIWQRWFPSEATLYPTGTLLQSSETGVVYLIEGMQKRAFDSYAALMRYDTSKIIGASENTLDQYSLGQEIIFQNFTLVRSPSGTVYLYNDGKRRGIASADVLRNIGINPDEIQDVPWSDLNSIPEGKKITAKDVYPAGALLQNKDTGAVVYVDPDAIRHPIWNKDILESNFKDRPIDQVSKKEIKEFEKGSPLKLADGELVMKEGGNTVYAIANGYKRPFESKEVFDHLGYQWDNIKVVSKDTLKLHPKGTKIKIESSSKKKKNKK